jgi:hypothetical protein
LQTLVIDTDAYDASNICCISEIYCRAGTCLYKAQSYDVKLGLKQVFIMLLTSLHITENKYKIVNIMPANIISINFRKNLYKYQLVSWVSDRILRSNAGWKQMKVL